MTCYMAGTAQLRCNSCVRLKLKPASTQLVAGIKRFCCAAAVIVLAAGCGQSVSKADLSAADARPNVRHSMDGGKFSFEILQPDVAAAALWKITATAQYYPAEYKKSTTVTTRHSNCNPSAHVPIIQFPRPCKTVEQRVVRHKIAPSDITFPNSNTIQIAVPGKIIDNNDEYLLAGLAMSWKPCAERCDIFSVQANISCVDDYKKNEIISLPFKISYSGESAPRGQQCSLVPPSGDKNWLTKEDILSRVRGNFGKEEAAVSRYLLEDFSLIPMPDGSWKSNPTAFMAHASFEKLCPLSPGMQTYARGEYSILLQKRPAWPVTSTAHVISNRRGGAEICSIAMLGGDEEGNFELYYFFVNGKLAQAEKYAQRKNQTETWRFIDGKPIEYIRRVKTSSFAGEMEIRYWHSIAAIAWPEAMSFTPDMLTFADHQRLADELECCHR